VVLGAQQLLFVTWGHHIHQEQGLIVQVVVHHILGAQSLKTLFVENFLCFAALDNKRPYFLGIVMMWMKMLSYSLQLSTSSFGGQLYPASTFAIFDASKISIMWDTLI
jgi:hypothetical protein